MRGYTIFNGSEIIETGQVDMTWDQIRAMRDQELDATDWRAVKVEGRALSELESTSVVCWLGALAAFADGPRK